MYADVVITIYGHAACLKVAILLVFNLSVCLCLFFWHVFQLMLEGNNIFSLIASMGLAESKEERC